MPRSAKAGIASQMMPASSGRPGPGDSSTASGSSATASSTVSASLRMHDRLGAELTEVLDEVVDEAVVAVDHEDAGHRRSLPAAVPRRRIHSGCRSRRLAASWHPPSARPADAPHRRAPGPATATASAGARTDGQQHGDRSRQRRRRVVALHTAGTRRDEGEPARGCPILMVVPARPRRAHRSCSLPRRAGGTATGTWSVGLGLHPRRAVHRHQVAISALRRWPDMSTVTRRITRAVIIHRFIHSCG